MSHRKRKSNVKGIFAAAPFLKKLGIKLGVVGNGSCTTSLRVQPWHQQQHGFIHAGVLSTLADHTAGGAARSVTGDADVITIEFKINFLRPAKAKVLHCRGKVLSAGKRIISTEAEVYAGKVVCAKLISTLIVLLAETAGAGKHKG